MAASTSSFIGPYELLREIGRGGFGAVYAAKHRETGQKVAIKVQKPRASRHRGRKGEDDRESDGFEQEIRLLRRLDHANVVRYIAALTVSSGRRGIGQRCVVLELAELGSLKSLVDKLGPQSESMAAILVASVLSGLQFVHEQGIVHRDIKDANILLSASGSVLLTDFGIATEDDHTEDAGFVGTANYMSPEAFDGQSSAKSDIWSLGCTMVKLLSGREPFHGVEYNRLLCQIAVEGRSPPLPTGLSDSCCDFLHGMFRPSDSTRLSARDLLAHPWLVQTVAEAERAVADGMGGRVGVTQLLLAGFGSTVTQDAPPLRADVVAAVLLAPSVAARAESGTDDYAERLVAAIPGMFKRAIDVMLPYSKCVAVPVAADGDVLRPKDGMPTASSSSQHALAPKGSKGPIGMSLPRPSRSRGRAASLLTSGAVDGGAASSLALGTSTAAEARTGISPSRRAGGRRPRAGSSTARLVEPPSVPDGRATTTPDASGSMADVLGPAKSASSSSRMPAADDLATWADSESDDEAAEGKDGTDEASDMAGVSLKRLMTGLRKSSTQGQLWVQDTPPRARADGTTPSVRGSEASPGLTAGTPSTIASAPLAADPSPSSGGRWSQAEPARWDHIEDTQALFDAADREEEVAHLQSRRGSTRRSATRNRLSGVSRPRYSTDLGGDDKAVAPYRPPMINRALSDESDGSASAMAGALAEFVDSDEDSEGADELGPLLALRKRADAAPPSAVRSLVFAGSPSAPSSSPAPLSAASSAREDWDSDDDDEGVDQALGASAALAAERQDEAEAGLFKVQDTVDECVRAFEASLVAAATASEALHNEKQRGRMSQHQRWLPSAEASGSILVDDAALVARHSGGEKPAHAAAAEALSQAAMDGEVACESLRAEVADDWRAAGELLKRHGLGLLADGAAVWTGLYDEAAIAHPPGACVTDAMQDAAGVLEVLLRLVSELLFALPDRLQILLPLAQLDALGPLLRLAHPRYPCNVRWQVALLIREATEPEAAPEGKVAIGQVLQPVHLIMACRGAAAISALLTPSMHPAQGDPLVPTPAPPASATSPAPQPQPLPQQPRVRSTSSTNTNTTGTSSTPVTEAAPGSRPQEQQKQQQKTIDTSAASPAAQQMQGAPDVVEPSSATSAAGGLIACPVPATLLPPSSPRAVPPWVICHGDHYPMLLDLVDLESGDDRAVTRVALTAAARILSAKAYLGVAGGVGIDELSASAAVNENLRSAVLRAGLAEPLASTLADACQFVSLVVAHALFGGQTGVDSKQVDRSAEEAASLGRHLRFRRWLAAQHSGWLPVLAAMSREPRVLRSLPLFPKDRWHASLSGLGRESSSRIQDGRGVRSPRDGPTAWPDAPQWAFAVANKPNGDSTVSTPATAIAGSKRSESSEPHESQAMAIAPVRWDSHTSGRPTDDEHRSAHGSQLDAALTSGRTPTTPGLLPSSPPSSTPHQHIEEDGAGPVRTDTAAILRAGRAHRKAKKRSTSLSPSSPVAPRPSPVLDAGPLPAHLASLPQQRLLTCFVRRFTERLQAAVAGQAMTGRVHGVIGLRAAPPRAIPEPVLSAAAQTTWWMLHQSRGRHHSPKDGANTEGNDSDDSNGRPEWLAPALIPLALQPVQGYRVTSINAAGHGSRTARGTATNRGETCGTPTNDGLPGSVGDIVIPGSEARKGAGDHSIPNPGEVGSPRHRTTASSRQLPSPGAEAAARAADLSSTRQGHSHHGSLGKLHTDGVGASKRRARFASLDRHGEQPSPVASSRNPSTLHMLSRQTSEQLHATPTQPHHQGVSTSSWEGSVGVNQRFVGIRAANGTHVPTTAQGGKTHKRSKTSKKTKKKTKKGKKKSKHGQTATKDTATHEEGQADHSQEVEERDLDPVEAGAQLLVEHPLAQACLTSTAVVLGWHSPRPQEDRKLAQRRSEADAKDAEDMWGVLTNRTQLACWEAMQDARLVLQVMSIVARGKSRSKLHLATPSLCRSLLAALQPAPRPLIQHPIVAQCVQQALDVVALLVTEPRAAEEMEAAGVVPALVHWIGSAITIGSARSIQPPHSLPALASAGEADAKSTSPKRRSIADEPATSSPDKTKATQPDNTWSGLNPVTVEGVRNAALQSLYSILRVHPQRQKRALAATPIVDVLCRLVDSPNLRTITVPLLCELANNGKRAARALNDANALPTLLWLAGSSSDAWATRCFTAIALWLRAQPSLATEIATPAGVAAVLSAVQWQVTRMTAAAVEFRDLLRRKARVQPGAGWQSREDAAATVAADEWNKFSPLLADLLRLCPSLTKALTSSPALIVALTSLLEQLGELQKLNKTTGIGQRFALSMLGMLLKQADNPASLLAGIDIRRVASDLAADTSRPFVQNAAKELLERLGDTLLLGTGSGVTDPSVQTAKTGSQPGRSTDEPERPAPESLIWDSDGEDDVVNATQDSHDGVQPTHRRPQPAEIAELPPIDTAGQQPHASAPLDSFSGPGAGHGSTASLQVSPDSEQGFSPPHKAMNPSPSPAQPLSPDNQPSPPTPPLPGRDRDDDSSLGESRESKSQPNVPESGGRGRPPPYLPPLPRPSLDGDIASLLPAPPLAEPMGTAMLPALEASQAYGTAGMFGRPGRSPSEVPATKAHAAVSKPVPKAHASATRSVAVPAAPYDDIDDDGF